MKVIICMLSACLVAGVSFGQSDKENKLLKELSVTICTCIDSISAANKSKGEVSAEIKDCIDKQATVYQLGSKLAGIDTAQHSVNPKTGKKEVNLSLNTNKDSKEYKQYYYEIERYLMENCAAIKDKIAANDHYKKHSMSENEEALGLYYKGLAEAKSGNDQKAIAFYKQALEVDSVFAFAWDNTGISYRRLGDYDKALYAYNKSLAIDPTGAMPLQNIAIVYQYKKEYQKAIEAYMRLKELDATNPEVYYGIGQIYVANLEDYEKGLDYICKAYNLYVASNSPYRTDAEKLVQYIYSEMKKGGKQEVFNKILKDNNISAAK